MLATTRGRGAAQRRHGVLVDRAGPLTAGMSRGFGEAWLSGRGRSRLWSGLGLRGAPASGPAAAGRRRSPWELTAAGAGAAGGLWAADGAVDAAWPARLPRWQRSWRATAVRGATPSRSTVADGSAPCGRRRHADCSPRRTPTRRGPPSPCQSGTAGTARRRASRSARRLPSGRRTWTVRTRRMRLFRCLGCVVAEYEVQA